MSYRWGESTIMCGAAGPPTFEVRQLRPYSTFTTSSDPTALRPQTHSPKAETGSARGLGRIGVLSVLFGSGAALVVYAATRVPVRNAALIPVVFGSRARAHWPIAATGLIVVLVVDAITAFVVLRRRRSTRHESTELGSNGQRQKISLPSRSESLIPRPLRFQRVPWWTLLVATACSVSGTLLAVSVYMGVPLWNGALWVLAPWVPVVLFEETWRYEHYGFYAIFVGLAVLQVGHLAEHTAQMIELLVNHGDLTRSHGVFGQLDFETVHFVWDSLVWLGACLLIYRYTRNRWLWISWVAASVHQVEHIYLFWVNHFHHWFWAHGGIFGIFGHGGLIGSPLARPYLHFSYNFVVVMTMLVGFWDETRRIYDRNLARALPGVTEEGLAVLTLRSRRVVAKRGELIPAHGHRSEGLFVICRGEVEVLRDGRRVDLLVPGQSFSARAPDRERPEIRATEKTEFLVVPLGALTDGHGPAGMLRRDAALALHQ